MISRQVKHDAMPNSTVVVKPTRKSSVSHITNSDTPVTIQAPTVNAVPTVVSRSFNKCLTPLFGHAPVSAQ
jgi:hypothetical protein